MTGGFIDYISPMRAAALCLLLLVPALRADPLRDADRETLMERLKEIQDQRDAGVATRFRAAVAAYRAASTSDTEAIDFFLKCTEKVEYEDRYRKSQDFREWRRRDEGRLKNQAFHRALRYQLQWLVLTLRVASRDEDESITKFAPQASALVDQMLSDLNQLDDQLKLLSQDVTGSVFAKAYEVNHVDADGWPTSPLDLEEFYDKVILPPLRKPDQIGSLRAAWERRIRQEMLLVEHEASRNQKGNTRVGMKDSLRSTDYDRFTERTYPQLLWRMEVDIFKAGAQQEASVRMLNHIEKYLAHPDSEKWSGEFTALISVNEELADPEAPAADETVTRTGGD